MQKLLVANWKLHPARESEAVKLAKASDAKGVVVCPPFPFLEEVGNSLRRASLGAQDLFSEPAGPYTGEVSAAMLKNLGVKYVIVGHSERRRWLGETDEMVNKKIKAALQAKLVPIVCVGEPKEVRRKGTSAARAFVGKQLRAGLKGISSSVVIAYEPIWAIGTGKPDDPKETVGMAHHISSRAGKRTKVLYGGSVTAQNVRDFLQYKDIHGALVGGASLKIQEFKKIIDIVKNL